MIHTEMKEREVRIRKELPRDDVGKGEMKE
jgi:hypothetical protein